jgi:hypothetical protein
MVLFVEPPSPHAAPIPDALVADLIDALATLLLEAAAVAPDRVDAGGAHELQDHR